MVWQTIAKGKSLSEIKATIKDQELPKGTPVRFEMTVITGVAGRLFDLAGAELIFGPLMPEGLDLKDVYWDEATRQVIVEAESDPVHLGAIILFVKAHWLAASLITIGLALSLGYIISSIRVKAPISAVVGLPLIIALVVIAVILAAAYVATKGKIAAPGIAVGGA